MRGHLAWLVALTAALGVALTACTPSGVPSDDGHPGAGHVEAADGDGPQAAAPGSHRPHGASTAPPSAPLREGERFVDLAMPAAYKPAPPTSAGTDDYRCFLLDPQLGSSAFVTGVDVLPGRADLVHHVILFRVPADQVAAAEAKDESEAGQGWTCFGGTGVGDDDSPGGSLTNAPWLGAWAPGGGERLIADDLGVPLEAGSRVVMQVHYNLLAGEGDDVSSARLRMTTGTADLTPLETVLLPAPVELPCRPEHADGPLCDREAALLDVMSRFGEAGGATSAGLQLLCGDGDFVPDPGPVQTCDRVVREHTTVRAVAGHMHLLGRSITIEANPGTDRARVLLDVPVWNFDDQSAQSLAEPAPLEPGDVLRVTCRHDQATRDMLPAFDGKPDRYVVWGEGTTDEMCLGIAMVTRP